MILVRPSFEEPTVPLFFDVIYDDDAIVALDKPAGLPVHPSATYHKHTLTFLLRERFGPDAPTIAHRIDRETSGLVLCARSLEAERSLKDAFENRRVSKRYLAVVEGAVEEDEGRIELPMAPAKEGLHILMEVTPEGEGYRCASRFRVVARNEERTLVALAPESGRQHQLRVHLSALGHPIVGDKLYGPDGVAPFLEYIETGMTDALHRRLGHSRHALHAYSLTFEHPEGGPMTLRAPLPEDLVALWGSPLDAAAVDAIEAC